MEKLFLATICDKRGIEKRMFLVVASEVEEAHKRLTDLNTQETEEDEPLFYAGDNIYIEPIEFRNNIYEM